MHSPFPQTPSESLAAPQVSTGGAMASLSLAMLLPSLAASIATVSLPPLMQVFGASFQAMQWVVLAYLLAVTTLIVSVGRLGDMIGRRRLLIGGIALFTIASAACGAAPGLSLLIAARAVQGLGAAVMMTLTMAFVGDLVPRAKTGSAMGLLGAMSAIGTSLGPSLGGLLIAGFGWRAIFLINVPLGVLALALAGRHLPSKQAASPSDGFDIAGTLLLGATLAAYALAMTLRGPGIGGPILLTAAGCGAGLFVVVEARVATPLVRPKMFRDPLLSAGLAMSLLVATIVMATFVVAPFYLSHALALDPAIAGLVLSAGPLVAATAGLPAGRLVDCFGARRMMTAGLAAMATGTLVLSGVQPALGIPGYVGPIALISMGYALFQAANNTAVMTGVAAERRGLVSGLLNLARNLGFITGASVMGALFAHAAAVSQPDAAMTAAAAVRGLHANFLAASALAVVALALSLFSARGAARRPRA